jgi:hypothetical protein
LDFNADGNLDILLVGSRLALYKGNGQGQFTDVTRSTGLHHLSGDFRGCATGDIDNDGWTDIYISAFRGGVLLHNEQGRSFRDITLSAGLAKQPWGSSCTFFDADSDGKLDLYIGNYVRFGSTIKPQLCNLHGIMTSCGPGEYAPERGVLYRNLGNQRFEDVTSRWKLQTVSGKTLGVAAVPLTNTGLTNTGLTLLLSNDQVPGNLMQFTPNGFVDRGVEWGTAFGADGRVYGGMGVDWGDYNNDGLQDAIIATFQGQAKPIFQNQGEGFTIPDTAGLGMLSSVPFVAFGVKWLDVENDGWLDLLITNGHVQDNIADVELFAPNSPGSRYRQPTLLYRNHQGRRFTDESARLQDSAQGLLPPIVGRGLAIGDYDNDGRVDALLVDSEGSPQLLHNVTPQQNNWLMIRLQGKHKTRDAYGSIVTVQTSTQKQTRFCHTDGSYLSASDSRLHFGIGDAKQVTVTVRWLGGKTQIYRHVSCNQVITLYEK